MKYLVVVSINPPKGRGCKTGLVLNIVNVSFSQSGGAGEVAGLLTKAESDLGMISTHAFAITSNLRREPYSRPLATVSAVLDEYIVKKNSFSEMFSFFRAGVASLRSGELEEFDVIHVHWSSGFFSVRQLINLPARQILVLTLHDLFFLTGGCHYTLGCQSFKTGCNNCPNVRQFPGLRGAIKSRRDEKMDLLRRANLITVPSQWSMNQIQGLGLETTIMRKVRVLQNPNKFALAGRSEKHPSKRAPGNKYLIVATDLQNPNKNIEAICDALLRRQERSQEIWLVGLRGQVFERLSPCIHWLGSKSRNQLSEVYRSASFLVSASQEEAFGLTVLEAAAHGTPSLVLAGTGAEEFALRSNCGIVLTSLDELATKALPGLESEEYTNMVSHGLKGAASHKPTNIARELLRLVEEIDDTTGN